jgi:hypothetical protein
MITQLHTVVPGIYHDDVPNLEELTKFPFADASIALLLHLN